jgi:ribonucleoside-diphosphate reductase beta chain
MRNGYTTTTTGLRRDSFPLRLYEKAKRLGVWNPAEIDFTRDRTDWEELDEDRRFAILQLTSQFVAGEEAVTLDLLPLLLTIAKEGRLEEELFLTTFLWEEGKHADFCSRWLCEVADSPSDLSEYHTPTYQQIFAEELPQTMNALLEDDSPAAVARAATTYNMVVEGVLAETGYWSYHRSLAVNDLMPGLCEGLVNIKRDESRHIAYGVYLLSRLVAEDASIWNVFEDRMNEMFPLTTALVNEGFEEQGSDVTPFGVPQAEILDYATSQFGKRYERISKARGRTLADLDAEPEPAEIEDLVTPT